MTKAELIKALQDDHSPLDAEMSFVSYNSEDGAMTTVRRPRGEFDYLEILFVETINGGPQVTMQLKEIC